MTFNCKPYKYSYEGQQTIADGNPRLTVTNPTAFDSRPYIKIYGSGTVRLMIQPEGQGTTTMVLSGAEARRKLHRLCRKCAEGRGYSQVEVLVNPEK